MGRSRAAPASDLPGDPVFARLADGSLRDLFDALLRPGGDAVTLVFGPGAGLVPHDVLGMRTYRSARRSRPSGAERQATSGSRLGNPGRATAALVDWPLLDRHNRVLAPAIDRYLVVTDPRRPRSLAGGALRESLHDLAMPALPYAADLPSQPVGRPVAPPTAGDRDKGTQPRLVPYELITPESGILLGDAEPLESEFELLMHLEGARVLGPDVAARFGFSFPIRFDYLDTLDGGHLSLQCHPTRAYAR